MTTVASATWALTMVGDVSGPGLLQMQRGCLAMGTAGIDGETGKETGGDGASEVATTVAGAWSTPTSGAILNGKLLEDVKLQAMSKENVGREDSVARLSVLTKLVIRA